MRIATQARAGLAGLWDEKIGWYLRLRRTRATSRPGRPLPAGLVGDVRRCRRHARARRMVDRLKGWSSAVKYSVPSSDPDRHVVRPDPLLAGAGLGARELAGRRRHEALRVDRRGRGAAAPRPARSSSRASPSTTTRATAPVSVAGVSRGAPRSRSTGWHGPGSADPPLARATSARLELVDRLDGQRVALATHAELNRDDRERERREVPLVPADEVGDVLERHREACRRGSRRRSTFAIVPSAASEEEHAARMPVAPGHRGRRSSCGLQATSACENRRK